MKREVKDHSIEVNNNIDEVYCPDFVYATLYIFYQSINKDNFIVIYANSYLEAKSLLFSFNPYADYVYNLNEYKLQYVKTFELYSICKIAPEWESIPTFVNKNEYNKLQKYITLEKKKTKILTKNLANSLNCDKNNNYWTTNEFVNYLKYNSENNINIKKEITEYLYNKAPLLKTNIVIRGINLDLYTNSKIQTDIVIDKLRETDDNINANYNIYNQDFVTGLDQKSINNYKELKTKLSNNENNKFIEDIKTPFFIYKNKYIECDNFYKKIMNK